MKLKEEPRYVFRCKKDRWKVGILATKHNWKNVSFAKELLEKLRK